MIKGSQTEYNKLSRVVLGRLDKNNTFPSNDLGMLAVIAKESGFHVDGVLDIEKAKKVIPVISEEIIETTQRELAELKNIFETRDIEVHQPEEIVDVPDIVTPDFTTTQFPVYCPRDILFNFRDLIIVSPNLYRSRSLEATYYHRILNEERGRGRVVIEAPRPKLSDADFDLSEKNEWVLNTKDPVFEAANTLIDGEHNAIYYQVSLSGNLEGYYWLKSVIQLAYPDVTVYPLHVYKGTHLDTTISILNYDTVALNPERITNTEDLPEPLRNRKHIFPDIIDTTNEAGLSSKWIGMNSLSISPSEVVVDADQIAYHEQLSQAGLTVIPHKLTYCDVIEGGHHCTSSDLARDENY